MAEPCRVCGSELCLVHCHYCGTECVGDEPDHAADCPSNTGLHPVEERDVRCPGGCGCYTGFRCSGCETELRVGDHYTHRQIGDSDGIPIYEPICIGCSAQEAVNA